MEVQFQSNGDTVLVFFLQSGYFISNIHYAVKNFLKIVV